MKLSPSRPRPGGKLSPRRAPLGEITASAANEISARVAVARTEPRPSPLSIPLSLPKPDTGDQNVFVLSPFPTKPSQVLLPSTVRKQRSFQSLSSAPQTPVEPERRPQVRLKRSVKTLRDLYEAQAEELARPESALSSEFRSSRPGTACSRLRSQSSSDGLSGKYAWEHFKSLAAADEHAVLPPLPSLPEAIPKLRHAKSRSPVGGVGAKGASTSSPNYRLHSPTSSPRLSVFRDLAQLPARDGANHPTHDDSTTLNEFDQFDSSPIVIKIGRSSSMVQLPALSELESFSDYQTLDTTTTIIAPEDTVRIVPPSSTPYRTTCLASSPPSSRKRKRAHNEPDSSSGTDDNRSVRHFKSSPPQESCSDLAQPISSNTPIKPPVQVPILISSSSDPLTMPSSPPAKKRLGGGARSPGDTSPVVQVINQDSSSSPERSSVSAAHASLQDALFTDSVSSSSPGPSDPHPVVRAPLLAQMAGLMVPKRRLRSPSSTDALTPRWPVRLSADTSLQLTTRASMASLVVDEEESELDMEYSRVINYMNESTNDSQVRIVPDSERHEGEDEVAALPGDGHDYRNTVLGMIRSPTGHLSGSGSSHSRANSLRSLTEGGRRKRKTSLGQSQSRPDSSGSVMSVIVPAWARRYYSGCYPDSFKYLAASTSNVNLAAAAAAAAAAASAASAAQSGPAPLKPCSSAGSRKSGGSIRSVGRSVSTHISYIVNNTPRRLAARKSHIIPGVGPLVSNPVQSDVITGADLQQQRQKPTEETPEGMVDPRLTIRPISLPLPIDPRAHWRDGADAFNDDLEGASRRVSLSALHVRPSSSEWISNRRSGVRRPPLTYQQRISHIRSLSPHLHRDNRLNTGSTTSRGFGYPYNVKGTHLSQPPFPPEVSLSSEKVPGNLRYRAQTACFLTGFVFPISWFIGAALPLPPRPAAVMDIEKRLSSNTLSGDDDLSENYWNDLRNQTRTQGKQEIVYQNARWWRRLNRFMCLVGIVVIVLVVVLSVVGTRNNW